MINKKVDLAIGVILIVLSFLMFTEWGFFTATFLNTNMLGDIPWGPNDSDKITNVLFFGVSSFLIGVGFIISGLLTQDFDY